MLGRPEGNVRCHQRQRYLYTRIARPLPQTQAQPADRDAIQDFANDDEREGAGGFLKRERAGHGRGHRKTVQDQGSRVVGEPFSFEDHEEPPRQPEPPRDRQRCYHVRRRNDGAEQESDRPIEFEHVMRSRRDRAGGEHHAAEGKQRNRTQIEAEIPPAHGDAGGIDQRRQYHQQHDFRRQLDSWQAWNEGDANSGNHQQD
jgi:hypothetical protein